MGKRKSKRDESLPWLPPDLVIAASGTAILPMVTSASPNKARERHQLPLALRRSFTLLSVQCSQTHRAQLLELPVQKERTGQQEILRDPNPGSRTVGN